MWMNFFICPLLHYWPFSINFAHYSWFVVVWCVLILVSFIHILQGHFLGSGATVELLPMTCKNQMNIASVPHLCYYLIAMIMFMRHIFLVKHALLNCWIYEALTTLCLFSTQSSIYAWSWHETSFVDIVNVFMASVANTMLFVSCDQAAVWMVQSVCPSACLSHLFTRGQFWPWGIVVACLCVSVCPSITSLSAQ